MHSILITGASRGIGRALALACARSGQYRKMILVCRQRRESLEEALRDIAALSDVRCCPALGDVSDPAFWASLRRDFGAVDTLVNNAGISVTGLLTDLTPEGWAEIMGVNVGSLYHAWHTFGPDMISAGSGRVLNVSSVWGRVGASCEVAYSASKGAVDAFTRALAREVAPSGIAVNAIAPGLVDTEMNAHLSPADMESLRQEIPLGRTLSPEEVAEAMMKLLDMPPSFTGQIVTLDGAWT